MNYSCPYCPFEDSDVKRLVEHLVFESLYPEIKRQIQEKWED